MKRLALLLLAIAPAAPEPAPARQDGIVRPRPADQPLHVTLSPTGGNVIVENDTQLYASVQIVKLDDDSVLQPHAQSVSPLRMDPALVGPQGNFGGYIATRKEFREPRGRNARVVLVTGGYDTDDMTEAERELSRWLLVRTVADQVLFPLLNAVFGSSIMDRYKVEPAWRLALGEIAANNHQLWTDLAQAWNAPGGETFLMVIWNFLAREFNAGSPIAGWLWTHAKINLAEWIATEAGRAMARRVVPFVNVVDFVMMLWNWGPFVGQMFNVAHDVIGTPGRLVFDVFFTAGVGRLSPREIRTDSGDREIRIEGSRLHLAPAVVTFFDRRGNRIAEAAPWDVDERGEFLRVRLPGDAYRNLDGHLTVQVRIGRETHDVRDRIRLVNQMRIRRIVPDEGGPGTEVRILGDDLSAFSQESRVMFDGRRAEVLMAHPEALTVRVPDLPEDPYRVKVWIVEETGGRTRESNKLEFRRNAGTEEELAERLRRVRMPEISTVLEGELTPEHPEATREAWAPAGMEFHAELLELDGTDGFALDHWGAALESEWVGFHRGPIRGRQPALHVRHATEGRHGARTYLVRLRLQGRIPIRYRVRVSTHRVDDLGTGRDAGDERGEPVWLPIRQPGIAHLYGDPQRIHEDREDRYHIAYVPEYQRVSVTCSVDGDRDARLAGVTLYRARGGRLEEAAASSSIGANDRPVELRHEEAEARGYTLVVRHGAGRVRYRLSLDVGHVPGPELAQTPIVSDFNRGTVDGWTVVGNHATTPQAPWLEESGTHNGYIVCRDTRSDPTGPLEVVVVIDTTGSMRGAIDSVKESTREIIASLRGKSRSLRLGLVAFRDHAADGRSARVLYSMTTDVDGRLRELAGWTAGGGGQDPPEDALYGIDGALGMDWGTEAATRAIVLITDAPAKVDGGGRDFGGRTIDSISTAARERGIRIYPIPIGGDGTLATQAARLARLSGGRVLPAARPENVAASILTTIDDAVDRSSPRFFQAPAKFLGDVSRFYGMKLQFDLRGDPGEHRFGGPDAVLEGAGLRLEFRTCFPVSSDVWAPRYGAERIRIPLTERGWTADGRAVDRAQFESVLRGLRTLRIRGEYYVGPESCALDNVVFGAWEAATDAGLSPEDLEWLEALDAQTRWLAAREAELRREWDNPIDVLRNRMGNTSESTNLAMMHAGDISRPLLSGSPSVVEALCGRERGRIRQNLTAFRARGAVTDAEKRALREDLAELRRRHAELARLIPALVNAVVEQALRGAPGPAEVVRQLDALRDPPAIRIH